MDRYTATDDHKYSNIIMQIRFYSSILCPRCHIVRKYLSALTTDNIDLKVEEIDIMLSPLEAWRDGVRMIPALVSSNNSLSGLLLSKSQVADFIRDLQGPSYNT